MRPGGRGWSNLGSSSGGDQIWNDRYRILLGGGWLGVASDVTGGIDSRAGCCVRARSDDAGGMTSVDTVAAAISLAQWARHCTAWPSIGFWGLSASSRSGHPAIAPFMPGWIKDATAEPVCATARRSVNASASESRYRRTRRFYVGSWASRGFGAYIGRWRWRRLQESAGPAWSCRLSPNRKTTRQSRTTITTKRPTTSTQPSRPRPIIQAIIDPMPCMSIMA